MEQFAGRARRGGGNHTEGEPSDSSLPRNFLLKAILITVAFIVWAVVGIGKVLLYSVGALLFTAVSLIELVAELVVMPIVLPQKDAATEPDSTP